MMAMASAKINVIVMAVRIFGAADGFRPKAPMLENPAAAMTIAGPNMQSAKITVSAKFRVIYRLGIRC